MSRRPPFVLGFTLLVAVSLPTHGSAQAPAPRLHDAWLREVLDLDVQGAAKAYREIARDSQNLVTERLVATARLAELHRLGIAEAGPEVEGKTLHDLLGQQVTAVEDKQALSASLQRELEAGQGDFAAAKKFLADAEVPQLRPLVQATAQAAAEQTDPAMAELFRGVRGRNMMMTSEASRVLERIRANEIVRDELAGRSADAAALRERAFPNWRPQPWVGDAAESYARVQENLASWQRERQLSSGERETLRQLEAALVAAAAENPERALSLLDRMPIYSERLRFGTADRR
ncbi:MAG: hypothetical protein ABL997_17455 [Planctomycetota bacterium]